MKNEEITPLRAQEMAASKAALHALRHPKPQPAPVASTQAPDQAARNSKAWGQGWRWGYYHHDETLQTSLTGQELEAFMAGAEAGFHALEVLELIPNALRLEELERQEKKAARKGRTEKKEV